METYTGKIVLLPCIVKKRLSDGNIDLEPIGGYITCYEDLEAYPQALIEPTNEQMSMIDEWKNNPEIEL